MVRLSVLCAGAWACLSLAAHAGDVDTLRLDLKGKSMMSAGEFSHAARAVPTDDDIEDVHFRYWRGYNRGYYGTGYYLPRLYAFRSGYWDGYYGGGYSSYYPRYYSYPTVRYYYPPVYSSYVTYYYPCSDSTVISTPTITLSKPRMPEADEPPAAEPRRAQPMAPADGAYPYDGPAKPMYRYNGDPITPVPMPAGSPKSTPQKIDPKDGRLVSIPATTKKIAYPAYGDHRRVEKPKDDVLTVKRD
jgi:hypothetical protein